MDRAADGLCGCLEDVELDSAVRAGDLILGCFDSVLAVAGRVLELFADEGIEEARSGMVILAGGIAEEVRPEFSLSPSSTPRLPPFLFPGDRAEAALLSPTLAGDLRREEFEGTLFPDK